MTEAEWPTCAEPVPMLALLRDKMSSRKSRLFAVVACRHSLQCFGHLDLDEAVDWTEADIEEAVNRELPEAITGAIQWATSEMCESLNCLGDAVSLLLLPGVSFGFTEAQQAANAIVEAHRIADVHSSAENEARHQCDALRDIFGNPFRHP